MNTPNKLTILRVLLIPVICLLLGLHLMLPAAIVFIVAAVTDFLDGYIARKNKLITNFGKFADPVADKLLVLTAMVSLCQMGLLPAWAVCIVVARELAVDGLRLIAVEQGRVVPAGILGKIKTNTQLLCVLSAMLSLPQAITMTLVILMSAMTLISGIQYFVQLKDVFQNN